MNSMGYDPYQSGSGMDPVYEEEEEEEIEARNGRGGNVLPIWGNQRTMNMNPLILTNVTNSPYFKVNLFEIKTYHEVVDQIYYKVTHLEPWEKGSRKTSGQTGMCGGVRGVGAGGIVSSAYCLLYKLFTLKLTRKQVNGLINHADSPYIRGLGFMYIRYTQPPQDLLSWFEDYLDDEEVIDVKAGGGKEISIGEMVKQFLTRLDWFDTRWPRIPVPVQKEIDDTMEQIKKYMIGIEDTREANEDYRNEHQRDHRHSRDRHSRDRSDTSGRDRRDRESERRDRDHNRRDRERDRDERRDRDRDRDRDRGETRRDRDHDRHKDRKDRKEKSRRSRSRERRRSRSRERDNDRGGRNDYEYDLKKFSEHRKKEKRHRRSRSRSRERKH